MDPVACFGSVSHTNARRDKLGFQRSLGSLAPRHSLPLVFETFNHLFYGASRMGWHAVLAWRAYPFRAWHAGARRERVHFLCREYADRPLELHRGKSLPELRTGSVSRIGEDSTEANATRANTFDLG